MNLQVNCYSLTNGTIRWSKLFSSAPRRSTLEICNFPQNKSVVIATESAFTVVSWTGQLVSHPQPIVIDGVFRTISSVAVHGNTILVGLPDGRICGYTPGF
jgi:hypothetical protein